ncbi:LysR family transcriptional regulator [Tabrizicola sp. TH137]|uniref:LysR family transcriptional regulator n=1 Tax=Tabrizicola sp. TH137 TaxID=2067452 RepID=UPI000C7BB951|nr:LysR family transcriptional regulator [Tabrizicola sp. TH137]PLL11568.1 LysR family transcriptional regulator [Tabrizicola sp. TH137]
MSELSQNELRRLDLTLLLVFLGLLRHRKATTVAAELGLTQSAISQALRRLREVFGDDLFLRRPHGMEPTAAALALEAPVGQAVEMLRGALGAVRAFDPAAARGVVRIAALDAEQAALVPRLAGHLRQVAPGLTLSVLPLGRAAAVEALTEGRADLAFGLIPDLPETISRQVLYDEGYLVAGLPAALPDAPVIGLDAYCAADHVLVSPGGDLRGVVDAQLERMGRQRRIILGLPAFLPALAAVAQSGALVTLPARIAAAFAPGFGLRLAEPPLPVRSFAVSAYWHRRDEADARRRWLTEQVSLLVQH